MPGSPRDSGLEFSLSGVGVRFRGLPEAIETKLHREWSLFSTDRASDLLLDVEVSEGGERVGDGPMSFKTMEARLDPHSATYVAAEGSATVRDTGVASVRLAPCSPGKQYYSLQNLVLACLAWRLPSREGAILHAAGAVIDGEAFVLVGPEGSGKTTWAGLLKSGGAALLSDDLVFVDGAGGSRERVLVLSTPFRCDSKTPAGPGRWPLAALLFPEHGGAVLLAPAPLLLARARLLANLPFVAEGFGSDSRIGRMVERLASGAPAHVLTFARSSSLVEDLRLLARGAG